MTELLKTFGRNPDVIADAPGRVNLIGEHTDYNGGFVLPMAIPQRTFVSLARRDDRLVRVASDAMGAAPRMIFELGSEAQSGGWLDYVQGTIVALRNVGFDVQGFDATIRSDVPVGAGVSSSAALEVALLRALRDSFRIPIDDVAIARIGRAAENDFVGAPVGIMDQMASSLADESTALFLDTRSLDFVRLPLPTTVDLVVIDSGVAHAHSAGEYRIRRDECQSAAHALGVAELRDVVDVERIEVLRPVLARRARHVITENARVLEAVECLRSGNVVRLGELFNASHASLRDDFEVSVPDVDRLVAIAQKMPDVFGARMTGGGFGGAIVALARAGTGADVAARTLRAYEREGGPHARVLVPPTRKEP